MKKARVTAGELCVVAASCQFGQTPLSAPGQTAAATDLVLPSPQGFERWGQHPAFRRHVGGVMADRLAALVEPTEAISFQRLDQRLARALLGRPNPITDSHRRQVIPATNCLATATSPWTWQE